MKLHCLVPRSLRLCLGLALGFQILLGHTNLQAAPAGAAQAHTNRMVPDELLVQFKENATDNEIADAFAEGGLKIKKHIQTPVMKAKGHHGVTHAQTQIPLEQALKKLKSHPAVEYAEPNWIYTHQATSNDPYYTGGYLWGAYGDLSSPANAFGSQAAEAWNAGYTGSKSIVIGVIDEGIEVTHPDLAPNIWMNPSDPVDGIDNDGNGYVDDVNGWNFVGNNRTVFDPTGDHHGTHVAGTIGASGGNGTGIVGVNWNVSIISGKFLGATGGTLADAIEAIDYFTALKTRKGVNIVALNNSWGGGGYSQALHDAILRAAKAGILFVAAAGNGDANGNGLNNDVTPNYPSNYDTRQGTSTESAANYNAVIAVAAIDSNGNKAGFSNYGATKVHLGAPGVAIYSTLPSSTYGGYSGTSMATPHVTGAVALYASTHPGATPDQIRTAILGSVTPTASLAGVTTTGGRLNLSAIVTPEVPATNAPVSAPVGLVATAAKSSVTGKAAVTLQWNAVSGASTYKVKRATSAAGPFTVIASGLTSPSYQDSVTANSTTYYYVVSAVSASFESSNSATASAQALSPAPRTLTATTVSRSQVNLSWADQSSDETGFKLEISTNGGSSYYQLGTVSSSVTAVSVTGLSANKTYYFRVRAYNSSANTAYSNVASSKTSS